MAIEVNYHIEPCCDDRHVLGQHVHELRERMNHNVLHVVPMDQLCSYHQLNINREPATTNQSEKQKQYER